MRIIQEIGTKLAAAIVAELDDAKQFSDTKQLGENWEKLYTRIFEKS
ncbi:hypothetical protein [Paenibacillus amylolyticus]